MADEHKGWILKSTRKSGTNRRDFGPRQKVVANSSSTLTVDNPLGFNFNAQALLDYVSIKLTEHMRANLLKGKHPSGKDMDNVAPLDPRSKEINPDRHGKWFNNTGQALDLWYLGSISGGPTNCKRTIKPYADPKWAWVLDAWLKRDKPVDIQSVSGEALEVIEKAINEFIEHAIGSDPDISDQVDKGDHNIFQVLHKYKTGPSTGNKRSNFR